MFSEDLETADGAARLQVASSVMLLSALSPFPGGYETAPVPVNVRTIAWGEMEMVMG